MLASETVNQVKAYTNIIGIISDYVTLKKRGRNHIGLCPFHDERSPSFTVSEEKQIWHCFGCQESGDHIAFIMKIDNLSFTEAVKHIAQKARIPIIETESAYSNQDEKERNTLQDILTETRDFYKKALTPNTEAFAYLTKRGLTAETLHTFHIGLATADNGLGDHLKNRNFPTDLIHKAGIIYQNEKGQWYPRFKNRIMFPILDHRGRTVGFGGRLYTENPSAPKYINTEETLLFNKRKILFGLNQAKTAIRKEKHAILMEGYMDVIMAHQFGFKTAVATMGTALTNTHIQLLKRQTETVLLAFDSDSAGKKAAESSWILLKQYDMTPSVIPLDQKDPADILTQSGKSGFETCLSHATSLPKLYLSQHVQPNHPLSPEQKSGIVSSLIPLVRAEKDLIIQRHLVKTIAEKLTIDESPILAKLGKKGYNMSGALLTKSGPKKNRFKKAEEFLICVMASDKELKATIFNSLQPGDFITEDYQKIVANIKKSNLTNKPLIDSFGDDQKNLKHTLSRLLIEGENQFHSLTKKQVEEHINLIKEHQKNTQISQLKIKLKEKEANGTEDEITHLLKELNELVKK